MCVHDIQRLFEGAILDMANNFTVKRRHIIPVFVQNCDRGGHKHTAESPLVMRTTATYPIDRKQGYRQRKQQSVHVCSGSADWRLVRCPPWWASCGARDTSLIRKGDDAFLGQNTISQRRIKPTQTGWLGRHIPRVHSYEHMFGVRGSAGVSETRQEAG